MCYSEHNNIVLIATTAKRNRIHIDRFVAAVLVSVPAILSID